MRWPDGSMHSNFNDPVLTVALITAFQETHNRRTAAPPSAPSICRMAEARAC
jgi:hypothetical protein